jgi:hypothetical protein
MKKGMAILNFFSAIDTGTIVANTRFGMKKLTNDANATKYAKIIRNVILKSPMIWLDVVWVI